MDKERGVALILALLVLSFLTILGGALLTTSTIDIWISDNYKSATQSLYLAEAGIDSGREVLRTSGHTAPESLSLSAGPDRQLLTGDDQPLIPLHHFALSFGPGSGSYEVWLQNDYGDGIASLTDSNEVVTLRSVGRVGTSRKTLEVVVQKGKFPEADSDPRLKTVSGLEALVSSITRNATDVYTGATMGDFGSAADYRVVVVNGDLDLGPGNGYGLLLVRGELNVVADVTWNGLIVVIGQGVVHWTPGVYLSINGGSFVGRTRTPEGSLLTAPAGVIFNITDAGQIKAANQRFPYNPIAIKEE